MLFFANIQLILEENSYAAFLLKYTIAEIGQWSSNPISKSGIFSMKVRQVKLIPKDNPR